MSYAIPRLNLKCGLMYCVLNIEMRIAVPLKLEMQIAVPHFELEMWIAVPLELEMRIAIPLEFEMRIAVPLKFWMGFVPYRSLTSNEALCLTGLDFGWALCLTDRCVKYMYLSA